METKAENQTLVKRASLLEVARKIDEASAGAVDLWKAGDSFEQAINLALAIQDLRAMLTPDVMQPIMGLMNTKLGFLTDRDPKRTSKPVEPYAVEVVRDCIIEGTLRGFKVAGNEMNIISGGFYGAKAGFYRRLTDGKTFPGLTDFKWFTDIPRVNRETFGGVVSCKASWKLNGVEDSIQCDIAVKGDSYASVDSYTGKAERKLFKRIHDRIAGVVTPDGETDGEPSSMNPADAEVIYDTPKRRRTEPTAMPNAGAKVEPTDDIPMGKSGPPTRTPSHTDLERIMGEKEVSFEQVASRLVALNWCSAVDTWDSVAMMPEALCRRILNAQGSFFGGIQKEAKP